jgi:hypothetical protein
VKPLFKIPLGLLTPAFLLTSTLAEAHSSEVKNEHKNQHENSEGAFSRNIIDINMDLDYIISMSIMMKIGEVKKWGKILQRIKQYSTYGQCFLLNLQKEANYIKAVSENKLNRMTQAKIKVRHSQTDMRKTIPLLPSELKI